MFNNRLLYSIYIYVDLFIEELEKIEQHFIKVVKGDIANQPADRRFFIDIETYRACFEEIRDVWEKTDLNPFLTHYCTGCLALEYINIITGENVSCKDKITRFCRGVSH